MADVTGITAVRLTSNSTTSKVIAGETIAIGDIVYLKDSVSSYLKADTNISSAEAFAKGIAVSSGILGSYIIIATSGAIELIGATLAISETYILSDTAGQIKPIADKLSSDFLTYIGIATTATSLNLEIDPTGIQTP